MRKLIFCVVCFVALAVPAAVLAGSGDSGFDSVVRGIEMKYHAHATRIPFMGFVSVMARGASHGGVANMHVAEFDDFTAHVDGDDLNRIVEQKLGPEWQRIVRETSKRGKEQTLVFVHPEGDRMGMFVIDADGSELDVVQLSVDPKHLNGKIGSYEHHLDESD